MKGHIEGGVGECGCHILNNLQTGNLPTTPNSTISTAKRILTAMKEITANWTRIMGCHGGVWPWGWMVQGVAKIQSDMRTNEWNSGNKRYRGNRKENLETGI